MEETIPMKTYNVFAQFQVEANNADEARIKVEQLGANEIDDVIEINQ